MADTRALRIRARGSLLGVRGGGVFAFLADEPPALFLIAPAGDGTVLIREKDSGQVLAAEAAEAGGRVVLTAVEGGAAHSRWALFRLTEDEQPIAVDTVDGSGLYLLRLAGTGLHFGRSWIEDKSLMPKPVVLADAKQQEPLYVTFA
ncbi:hypothetical protein ACFVVX_33550 [Kitasatospora sp. NPDC058170]|uniref:hypothetical protein n=1 Tax=Kitasatospora sp. NPDC058170 TaxID=3346364 RepID=UPI0036DAFBE3